MAAKKKNAKGPSKKANPAKKKKAISPPKKVRSAKKKTVSKTKRAASARQKMQTKSLPAKDPISKKNREAFENAEKDIERDPDLSIHSPNDGLDEGETARLGEDKTDLV